MKLLRKKKFNTLNEQRNWFNNLNKTQKRIAIAEDVLWSLKNKNFKTTRKSGYVSSNDVKPLEKYWDNDFLKGSYVLGNIKECDVCALGALFVSKVSLGNSCLIPTDDLNETEVNLERNSVTKTLRGIFSDIQMDMIEAAFEVINSHSDKLRWYDYRIINSIEFGSKISTSDSEKARRKRLKAIAKNIIKYGKFDPVKGLEDLKK